MKAKGKDAKNPVFYQLWYNRDMLDVNLQSVKTNPWLRGVLLIGLIALALWMARSKLYSFTSETAFTTITGEHIVLKALHGKPVLVTFWATSCPSCIKEIPHLVTLYKQFHSRGLEIIAIAMAYDRPNQVVAMTREQKLPYLVVLDITSEYARQFGRVWATPTTLLIDQNGTVAKRKIGAFELMDMQARIEQLLKG